MAREEQKTDPQAREPEIDVFVMNCKRKPNRKWQVLFFQFRGVQWLGGVGDLANLQNPGQDHWFYNRKLQNPGRNHWFHNIKLQNPGRNH